MIKSNQAKAEFKQVVKSDNFMTPTVLGFYLNGGYTIELSRGEGITGGLIYGVTVVNRATKKQEYELSECFNTLKEAKNYMEGLSK
jgi:hypothetical protein